MSELKAYLCEKASEIETKEFLCYIFKSAGKPAIEPMMEEVYIKSEADKVIEELKKEKKYAIDNVTEVINTQEREIRHQKYKRCFGMAQEWRNYASFCGMQSSCHNHRGFGKTAEKWTWKESHAWKCVHRWQAIAEKFKPNSTAQ